MRLSASSVNVEWESATLSSSARMKASTVSGANFCIKTE